MKQEQMRWFRDQLEACKEWCGRIPEEAEYRSFVVSARGSAEPPLFESETELSFQDLVSEAVETIYILQGAITEVEEKRRHMETNLHHRKYNDSNF